MPAPRRVFLSYTAELAKYPEARSFVEAASSAVTRSQNVPITMNAFPARDAIAASYCEERVRECDVYVGILGLCYGTPVADRPDVSHVQIEFEAAGRAGIPRLIFLLDQRETIPIPAEHLIDLVNGQKQARFRAIASNLRMVKAIGTPEQLEILLYQSLLELQPGVNSEHATDRQSAKPHAQSRAGFEELLANELLRHLRHPNVVSLAATTARFTAIKNDPYLGSMVKDFNWLDALFRAERETQARLGVIGAMPHLRAFTQESPIRIAVSPSLVGIAAILQYLRAAPRYRLNLELDFAYTHAAALVTLLQSSSGMTHDGAAVLLAPATTLLTRRSRFEILTFVPSQSYRLLTSSASGDGGDGEREIYLPLADKTGASVQLARLLERTDQRNSMQAIDIQPSDALPMLQATNGGERFLLWSPQWAYSISSGTARALPDIGHVDGWEDVVFLLTTELIRRHTNHAAELRLAIRSAWLDLLESDSERDQAVQYLLDNAHFVTCFKRMLGLTNLLFDR